jgi:hypothetical protein
LSFIGETAKFFSGDPSLPFCFSKIFNYDPPYTELACNTLAGWAILDAPSGSMGGSGPAEAPDQPNANDPGSSGQMIMGNDNTQIIGNNNTINYGDNGGGGGGSGGGSSGDNGLNSTARRLETQPSGKLSFAMFLMLSAGRFLW